VTGYVIPDPAESVFRLGCPLHVDAGDALVERGADLIAVETAGWSDAGASATFFPIISMPR
jgi:hypothetical protein